MPYCDRRVGDTPARGEVVDGDVVAEAADEFRVVLSEGHDGLLRFLVDDDGFRTAGGRDTLPNPLPFNLSKPLSTSIPPGGSGEAGCQGPDGAGSARPGSNAGSGEWLAKPYSGKTAPRSGQRMARSSSAISRTVLRSTPSSASRSPPVGGAKRKAGWNMGGSPLPVPGPASARGTHIAVGTPVARRPPHRSGRAR